MPKKLGAMIPLIIISVFFLGLSACASSTSVETPTPEDSPTPYPTYTPADTVTPYPTYTPAHTSTPYPTYTPAHTATSYPTYTPHPMPGPLATSTPYSTYTPYPTFTPTSFPVVCNPSWRIARQTEISLGTSETTARDNLKSELKRNTRVAYLPDSKQRDISVYLTYLSPQVLKSSSRRGRCFG